MQGPLNISRVDRVPVIIGNALRADAIKVVALAEVTPEYPLTSVFLSSAADTVLREACADLISVDWADLTPPFELKDSVYANVLANLVAHHISARWLPSDRGWIESRCLATKGCQDVKMARDMNSAHSSAFLLVGLHVLRFRSDTSGRLEITA